MPGTVFNIYTRFSSGNGGAYSGGIVVNPPPGGNNPQSIDQYVDKTIYGPTAPGYTSTDQRIAGPGQVVKTASASSVGTGYVTNDIVILTGGNDGSVVTATATATVSSGVVTAVTLNSAGSGYTIPPTVILYGGGGTGAVVTATLSGGGVSSTFTINNGGSGYTSAPTVVFATGNNIPAQATVTASAGVVSALTLTNQGSGYQSVPTGFVKLTGAGTSVTGGTYTIGGGAWLPSSNLGQGLTNNNAGGGFGLASNLITAGSAVGYNLTIKFINAIGGTTIKTYTLTDQSSVVARDAIGVNNDFPSCTISEIDVTPDPNGAIVEVLGLLNLNS